MNPLSKLKMMKTLLTKRKEICAKSRELVS